MSVFAWASVSPSHLRQIPLHGLHQEVPRAEALGAGLGGVSLRVPNAVDAVAPDYGEPPLVPLGHQSCDFPLEDVELLPPRLVLGGVREVENRGGMRDARFH